MSRIVIVIIIYRRHKPIDLTKELAQAATPLICIRQMPGSNLFRNIDYPAIVRDFT
jgi:hypothetical protein